MKKTMLSIFIGSVITPACGQWVDLPTSNDHLNDIIATVKAESQCEEYMISDYEGLPGISAYKNLYDLNQEMQELAEFDEWEREVLVALMEEAGYSYEDALDVVQNQAYCVYYDCYDMTDVAKEIVNESGLLDSMPENLRYYFDYEAYGRDLDIEGDFYYAGGGKYIEVYE